MIPDHLNPLGISVNENLPLTFTAQQANSTVKLTATGSPTISGLHYRLGKSGLWLPYTIGTTITLAKVGDSVQFWNSAENLSSSSSNYVNFVLTGTVKAQGNIQSLLNFSRSCKDYCFISLFASCTSLMSAPALPATTLADSCYRALFNGCSALTVAPKLPATALATSCYRATFLNCSGLTTAPALPATTIAPYCYNSMFNGCSSLVIAPKLPAVTLRDNCYSYMFRYCTNLSSMEVSFTNWNSSEYSTYLWHEDVALGGTFTKPTALPEEYGADKIPSGWTVINK